MGPGSPGRVEGACLRDTLRIPMATAKEDAKKILDGLPEEASLEDIQYHLYVLGRIQRGREDVAAGRFVSQDEIERRLPLPEPEMRSAGLPS